MSTLRFLFVQSPLRAFALSFLLICLFLPLHGGHNSTSRFAALSAMSESFTFRIDDQQWSLDFSRTPDGHIYSNKAPGPVFLSFPAFFVADHLITLGKDSTQERNDLRRKLRYVYLHFLAFFFEALPFALVALFWAQILREEGYSDGLIQVFGIAFFTGTTGALFMNSFFGHGFATWLAALAFAVAWKKRPALTGLIWGWALLSDYGSVFLLPGLLLLLLRGKSLRQIPNELLFFLLGGLLPGGLWIWYHTSCFGSPFALPQEFQNPVFVDGSRSDGLGGVMQFFPRWVFLRELLIGSTRGILFTQPWIYIVGVCGFLSKKTRIFALSAALGLGGLLWMNAAFHNWHGGDAAGPRYLAIGLIPFAMLVPESLQLITLRPLRMLLFASIIFSFVLFLAVFSNHLTAPPQWPLWSFLWNDFIHRHPLTTPLVRMMAVLVLFGVPFWRNRQHIARAFQS